MPAFMGGAIVMQKTMMDGRIPSDGSPRSSSQGVLYEPLARAAEARNQAVTADDGTVRAGAFVPSRVDAAGRRIEDVRLELSDRIRRKEIFAFVEIPSAALDMGSLARLRYHSNHPAHNDLPRWLEATLGREIVQRRFEAASLDRKMVDPLTRTPDVEPLGLLERNNHGEIKEATAVDRARTFAIPVAFMMSMFLLVMTSSPQLLNSVIEEKMSRISEVLVASVTPFQLMMGKLLGSVGVSLLLGTIYLAGGYGLAGTGATGPCSRRASSRPFSSISCWPSCSSGRCSSPSAPPARISRTRRT